MLQQVLPLALVLLLGCTPGLVLQPGPPLSLPPDRTTPVATVFWTGAVSGAWNDPGNWSTGVVPGSGDRQSFPTGAPNRSAMNRNIPGNRVFGQLKFQDDYVLRGNPLAFT